MAFSVVTFPRARSDRLTQYVDLFVHWDESYWYAVYAFLLVQGALVAGFIQVLASGAATGRLWIPFSLAGFGAVLSGLWLLVLHRKMTYTHGCESVLKELLPEVYERVTEQQKRLAFARSSFITKFILPMAFATFWVFAASRFNPLG